VFRFRAASTYLLSGMMAVNRPGSYDILSLNNTSNTDDEKQFVDETAYVVADFNIELMSGNINKKLSHD
jgi:hypothetical protein